MKTIKSFAVAVSFFVLSPFFAKADTILINFSGTITFSSVSAIPYPTPYSGQLVYTLPAFYEGSDLADADYFYNLNGPGNGLTVSIGSYTFSTVGTLGNGANILYQSSSFGINGDDVFEFADGSGAPAYAPTGNLPGYSLDVRALQLAGSPAFLASPAMPAEMNFADLIPVSSTYQTGITLDFNRGFGELLGSVDSIQLIDLASTPEPSTMTLTALSLLGAGFAAWRSTRRTGSAAPTR